MSKRSVLTQELEAFPEKTVLYLLLAGGEITNIAFRCRDLDGKLGWALSGIAEPWSSDLLATGILAVKGGYLVVSA